MQTKGTVHEQIGKAKSIQHHRQETLGGGEAAATGGDGELLDAPPPHRDIFSQRARMGNGGYPK